MSSQSGEKGGGRLHGIDAARGLAALSVMIFHWPHLLHLGTHLNTQLPWPGALKMIYSYGWLAVDFFFALSGFVFFWLYEQPIRTRALSPWGFAVLRLSRLYPLFLISLVAVALLQIRFTALSGHPFIYAHNDALHFLAQIFMFPSVEFDHLETFNGPTWSITIEICLYAIFYLLAWLGLSGGYVACIMIPVAGVLIQHFSPAIGRGLCGFFLGGLMFRLWSVVRVSRHRSTLAAGIILSAAILWCLALVNVYVAPVSLAALLPMFPKLALLVAAKQSTANYVFVTLILLPLTVAGLALLDDVFGIRLKPLSSLGDLTYGTYLLHFPVQLVIALWFVGRAVPPDLIGSPYALILFIAVVAGIAALSFKFIEMPAQRLLRKRLLRRRSPAETPTAADPASTVA
jgi:peptidoglycan/LPS O-acetylase OafA/YrhL